MAEPFDWLTRIQEAGSRIYKLAHETPTELIEENRPAFTEAEVYLKCEHLQKTGSFKLRGATNKILALSPEAASRGVLTSSTGNHALGVATAARYRSVDAEVYVSSQVPATKMQLIENLGARIRHAGDSPLAAENAARNAAQASRRTYISPYNDPDVIAGQGTISMELLKYLPQIDAIYVSVGGGGLISGIGTYLKAVSPATSVVACWPENSRVMYESLRAKTIIDFPEEATLSQSTAGGVEKDSVTFDVCKNVIDRSVLVSEQEILYAMRWAHNRGWAIEGAAGVAIAAYTKEAHTHRGQKVVIISCGGNTSPEVLSLL